MARWRLRLSADRSELAGWDSEAGLRQAQSQLRDTRDDVVLTHVEQLAPDAIGVLVLVAPTVGADDIDDIAADLRAALGIGPGTNELIPDEARDAYVIRGIGEGFGSQSTEIAAGAREAIAGPGQKCCKCGISGGHHLPGCPLDIG